MQVEDIQLQLTEHPKTKPDEEHLEFGTVFTDHMFTMDYTSGHGWHDPKIVPFSQIDLSPSAMIFHYGQTVFEGLKAYRTKDDTIQLFRPEQNFKRMNNSNKRMCMPQVEEDFLIEATKKLVEIDQDWVPHPEGTSLYIRPFLFATEPFLGVRPSRTYTFMIILSPVGQYYKEGINPVKIAVEDEYIRSVLGGTGEAKTAGNYAASLIAQEKVGKEGFAQVLWLDGISKEYIEEVGSMNVFFKINGTVVTPALNGSILPGVTRDSVIKVLKSWDIPVEERKISMQELIDAHESGKLEEAFGTGTAAVISPIGQLTFQSEHRVINNFETGQVAHDLHETITGIQYGEKDDSFDWIIKL